MGDCDRKKDVIVSGLSGHLPNSESIEEFAKSLYEGVDLVTEDERRWPVGFNDLPKRGGKLKDLSRFDASFFGINGKQANHMDPQLRLLLGTTYECIVDAGYNPAELRGSRTGVFVGVSSSESEWLWSGDPNLTDGYTLSGCSRAMFANRLSYAFDLRGPSLAIDTMCSSAGSALAQAFTAITTGSCEMAIVAGSNLTLHPSTSLNFQKLRMLSADGRCATFDASGAGYVRSEAVVCLLLQRREVARRVYCTVRGAMCSNDGYKQEGITYPAGSAQRALAEENFRRAGLKPQDVSYVEAHGTGTQAGDTQEVNALADLYCPGRTSPLPVGSVKSNIGHTEAAAAMCSIAKVVVAMERGVLPGNLHFKTPRASIPALSDGRLQVVDKNMEWNGGLVAINTFGFGGANAHVILESEPTKPQMAKERLSSIPRLLVASGRSEDAVREILQHAENNADSAPLHALLDAIHSKDITGHMYRGHRLLNKPETERVAEVQKKSRLLWFVFNGMGSQWAGAGRTLLELRPFAAAIDKCAEVLTPLGIDLHRLLTDTPAEEFDNDLNAAFVTVASIQVGLVDVLRELGLKPDGIIGHSLGEGGCAYADGGLSAQQTVLSAYWRCHSFLDANLPKGAMAAVGMSWKECKKRCPAGVQPACHNAEDSVTVSGEAEAVSCFVKQLQSEGVFARAVNSAGAAFHSRLIEPVKKPLRKALEELIKDPKPRTNKWISTSLLEQEVKEGRGKLCDAEYFVNNMLSQVYFAEALRHVPSEALLVEIGPHALLRGVLKRALPQAHVVPLLQKGHAYPLQHLLQAIGEIYNAGAQPDISALYERVSWPVPRGTPGIASHIRWDHQTQWAVAKYDPTHKQAESTHEFDLKKDSDKFLADRTIYGQVLFPEAGYLVLVWKTLSKLHNRDQENTAVVFEDVDLKSSTVISTDHPTKISVEILRATGDFVVTDNEKVLVTGRVRIVADLTGYQTLSSNKNIRPYSNAEGISLNSEDIYKDLRLRGYQCKGIFRGILSSDFECTKAEIAWHDNWITFLDSMLQLIILNNEDPRKLQNLKCFQWAYIDPVLHQKLLGNGAIQIKTDGDSVFAESVELRGVKMDSFIRRPKNMHSKPNIECAEWVSYSGQVEFPSLALIISLQIVLENVQTQQLRVSEIAMGRQPNDLLLPHVLTALKNEPWPLMQADATLAADADLSIYASLQEYGIKIFNANIHKKPTNSECHLVIASNILAEIDDVALNNMLISLSTRGFLLLDEPVGVITECASVDLLEHTNLRLVSRQATDNREFLLFQVSTTNPMNYTVVEVTGDEDYMWIEPLKDAMRRAKTESLIIYAITRSETSGIVGMAACLRAESGGRALRIYQAPNVKDDFSLESGPFADQAKLDLTVNVLNGNIWGSYRHLPFETFEAPVSKDRNAYVDILVDRDLSSLCWVESNQKANEPTNNYNTEQCRVEYVGLDKTDVLLAVGQLSKPSTLHENRERKFGMDFSGYTEDGRRVMGIATTGGLSTLVAVPRDLLWNVPSSWRMEEAATVPLAYVTAYYALVVRGRISSGANVLIQSGASVIGQAAIRVALHAECNVFVTADTSEQRSFLARKFERLNADHIGKTLDPGFRRLIRAATEGHGVQVVLHLMSQKDLRDSATCLAVGGCLLEICHGFTMLPTSEEISFLGMSSYNGIVLEALWRNSSERSTALSCVSNGLATGVVQPLDVQIFPHHQLELAFRTLDKGDNLSKIIIQVGENTRISARPRCYMDSNKSYVLVGGLGGLGLELTEWLIARGATKLVLTSRRGVSSGYQARCVQRWRKAGLQVLISNIDACTEQGARDLLNHSSLIGPVGGVFNLAGVLRDALFDHQNKIRFQDVARPKIAGTKVLDAATRKLCPELDYFVVFSSVSSGRGNKGQSNYGYANSAMERIIERRVLDGLPGTAIQWGAVEDVGMAAGMRIVAGTVPQELASWRASLDIVLSLPNAVVACMVPAEKQAAVQEKADMFTLDKEVAKILGVPASSCDATLSALGMDSLNGAEIQKTLQTHHLELTMQEIRELTLKDLKDLSRLINSKNLRAPAAK